MASEKRWCLKYHCFNLIISYPWISMDIHRYPASWITGWPGRLVIPAILHGNFQNRSNIEFKRASNFNRSSIASRGGWGVLRPFSRPNNASHRIQHYDQRFWSTHNPPSGKAWSRPGKLRLCLASFSRRS